MRCSMIAVAVCGWLVGCGGALEEGESIQEGESLQGEQMSDAEVVPSEGEDDAVSALRTYTSSYSGAVVTFNTTNDDFRVQDTASDGHSAVLQISGFGYCWNHSGAGTSLTCKYDFAEGINISFRACSGDYGTRKIRGCAAWKSANTAN